ncbi:DUF7519 family protein [Natronorubrum bangense]|uniref:DUF7519 family protein n=1 Tax=Natronorubrum bangense TaxID=61858 RepID=UPI001375556C|nr:hypothetical protein [Natronorubrum bangense]
MTSSAVSGLIIGAVLATAIAAVDHDRLRGPLIGGGVLLIVTATAIGLPAHLVRTGEQISAAIVIAGILVGLGIARFRIDAVGNGAVSRAIAWVARVGILLGVVALLVSIVALDVGELAESAVVGGSFEPLITPTTGSEGVLGFVVLSWLTLGSLWLVAAVLPPEDIFDSPQRDHYQRVVSGFVRIVTLVLGGSGIAIVVAFVLGTEMGLEPQVIGTAIDTLVGSSDIRAVLLRILVGAVVLTVLIRLLRSAGPAVVYGRPAWLPSGLVITTLLLVSTVAGASLLNEGIRSLEFVSGHRVDGMTALVGQTGIGTFVVFFGVLAVGGTLLILPLLSGLGILPTYTAGPRLALLGLITAGIAGAAADAPSPVVFGTVVGAIIAWDVAEHGAELTADVGRTPAHREGELIHAGGALLTGGGVMIGLIAVNEFLFNVQIGEDGALTVVGLAVIAIVILAVLFRN